MTITHDEVRAPVALTRRARRQLDEAAGYVEAAAFAALMGASVDDFARMGACTEALTVLSDLGARSEVDVSLVDGENAVAAAVAALRGIEASAFADPHYAGVIAQLADDLSRRFHLG